MKKNKETNLYVFFFDQLTLSILLEKIKLYNYEYSSLCTKENTLKNLIFLKNHNYSYFKSLTAISGSDFPENKNRFEVAYELLSIFYNQRFRLKVFVNSLSPLESITSIYPSANWWEREVWDLFGVFFTKHPDLRRILTDYGFQGHPLRKDFPLSGYYELLYSEKTKRVIMQALELSQDFRLFEFQSPWVRGST